MNAWDDDNEEQDMFDRYDPYSDDFNLFRKPANRLPQKWQHMYPDDRGPGAGDFYMDGQIDNFDPHYSNDTFKNPQTIWGMPEDGLGYDYSDRIREWSYEKAERAAKVAGKTAKYRSARWVEIYLTEYFGKPAEIRHIIAGVNVSSGYPYQVFGYRFVEPK